MVMVMVWCGDTAWFNPSPSPPRSGEGRSRATFVHVFQWIEIRNAQPMVNVVAPPRFGEGRGRGFSLRVLKHSHLRRRTEFGVLRADRHEAHRVAEAPRDGARPVLELAARPFETMVGMAEFPRGERWPVHVVLAIWRRQHNRSRAGALE